MLHQVFERSKWSIFTPCVHNGDPEIQCLGHNLPYQGGTAAAAMAQQLLCQSLLHISLRRARTIKHGYHTRVMKPDAKKRFQRLNYLILNQLHIIGRTWSFCFKIVVFLQLIIIELVFAAAAKRGRQFYRGGGY